jgi:hypothetical protein
VADRSDVRHFVIAEFTVVLARVAWNQTRDARILQRAYLNVKFGDIQSDSGGELVGHVTLHIDKAPLHLDTGHADPEGQEDGFTDPLRCKRSWTCAASSKWLEIDQAV